MADYKTYHCCGVDYDSKGFDRHYDKVHKTPPPTSEELTEKIQDRKRQLNYQKLQRRQAEAVLKASFEEPEEVYTKTSFVSFKAPKTIGMYQQEIKKWVDHNFPDEDLVCTVGGLVEEVGEAFRAIVKMRQGIRGTEEEWMAELYKELGDIFIKLCDISSYYKWELQDVIEDRWNVVKLRDWQEDKIGHGIGE